MRSGGRPYRRSADGPHSPDLYIVLLLSSSSERIDFSSHCFEVTGVEFSQHNCQIVRVGARAMVPSGNKIGMIGFVPDHDLRFADMYLPLLLAIGAALFDVLSG